MVDMVGRSVKMRVIGSMVTTTVNSGAGTTAHYADIVVTLPAICEVCKQEITHQIWITNGRTYCHEHAPEYKEGLNGNL